MIATIRKSGPLAVAARLATSGAPVDRAEVARVRQLIATGCYTVDPHRIAGALIGFGR